MTIEYVTLRKIMLNQVYIMEALSLLLNPAASIGNKAYLAGKLEQAASLLRKDLYYV